MPPIMNKLAKENQGKHQKIVALKRNLAFQCP